MQQADRIQDSLQIRPTLKIRDPLATRRRGHPGDLHSFSFFWCQPIAKPWVDSFLRIRVSASAAANLPRPNLSVSTSPAYLSSCSESRKQPTWVSGILSGIVAHDELCFPFDDSSTKPLDKQLDASIEVVAGRMPDGACAFLHPADGASARFLVLLTKSTVSPSVRQSPSSI